jgi:hypothetical protein
VLHNIRRNLAVAAAGALVAGALVAPAAASAKTHKVNVKVTQPCKQVGTKICATYSGKPFGTCKMTGELVIPKTIQTWRCKGGSFVVTGTGTTGASNDAKGTWKASKGTGKYKGIKAKGTFSGRLSTGIFFYKGKAKY